VADTTLTWSELQIRSHRLACGLRSLGVGHGDRIGSITTDRIECLELAFAAAALAAIWVPIAPFLKGTFLRHQIQSADLELIIADAEGICASEPYTGSLPVIGFDSNATGAQLQDIYTDGDLTPADDGSLPAAILFTSGTTGPAKGCVVSQGYFAKAGACYAHTLQVSSADIVYTAFPLYHGAGLATAMMAVLSGASFYHPGSFSASGYLRGAIAAAATVAIGTGGMAAALLAQPVDVDDQRHALRVTEWVPLSKEAQQRFSERFGVAVYGEHYGQTECMITTQTPMREARNPGSAGRESPLVEMAVIDDDGNPLPAGTVGEIVLRPRTSGAMFSGYWNQPAETLAAWRNLWHHTGDFGAIDTAGILTFIDRKSDSLRRRGENVSSVQVEATLLEHPDIEDVAVHGMASAMTEDDIKACIITRPGAELHPASLFDYCARTLPYYAIPRYVDIVEMLPRTPNQKVRKDVLRERGNTASTWDFEELGLAVDRAQRRRTTASSQAQQ
jgi:carnitine-CoA ligase